MNEFYWQTCLSHISADNCTLACASYNPKYTALE